MIFSCSMTDECYRVGAVIQSTLNEEQSTSHASALSDLTARASSMIGMLNRNESDDGDDELTFLRIRSKHREVMVSGESINSVETLAELLKYLNLNTQHFRFLPKKDSFWLLFRRRV